MDKRFNRVVRRFRSHVFGIFLCLLMLSWLSFQINNSPAQAGPSTGDAPGTAIPHKLQLDSHLPVVTYIANSSTNNVNAKFGSRFDFVISPSTNSVQSGTDGVYHDNSASYIVGIAPTGEHKTFIFHMGAANASQGDTYLSHERWTPGLDTSRWEGDASDGSAMHLTVDFIDTFLGEPGCTFIANCASSVRDDTVPVLLVGVSLQNTSMKTLTGNFLFGSNRSLPTRNACVEHTTPGGTAVNVLSYDTSSDATNGTLFLAGNQSQWRCNTGVSDRAGLAWNYSVEASQTQTSYMLIGGWNPSQDLFANTQLPAGCQREVLFPAQEWSSENAVVDFAIDNLSARDNLLARAQAMENMLINNTVLTSAQRWVIADSIRTYKSSSWLVGRLSCAGGGYDAAVYEGAFGFLTTVDVMHEYGYFEINRVPWFFRSAISIVFKNVRSNSFGIFFQHDQGGDVNIYGVCTSPGRGIPTIQASCYGSPRFPSASPMPTEEDSNVALLTAYYISITGDTALLTDNNNENMNLIDAGMRHNQRVGDPNTGIAYNFQDTNTTFDDQKDCLHNDTANAGNLYYQGLKEATAYRATAYLEGLVPGNNNGDTWKNDASKIENAMVQEYNVNGYIPLARNNNAYNNCSGRSVVIGEGLFYLHLIGLDNTMNQTLLQDLAKQYPRDLSANALSSPSMISLESARATGSQCPGNVCPRYEWFSKVMLSGIIADLVYAAHGCDSCTRMDVTEAVYGHNVALGENFGDGLRDNGQDWVGHYYPRGMISWAFLDAGY
jgi:glycosyl hydrolase family 52